jgi:hypothetical protein
MELKIREEHTARSTWLCFLIGAHAAAASERTMINQTDNVHVMKQCVSKSGNPDLTVRFIGCSERIIH